MAKYQFSAAERYAVFTVHNERCWLCREPVGLFEVQVDHVVPEALIGTDRLAGVLAELGLPPDHEVNGFANWLPVHGGCNRRKSDRVFEPSPMIQLELQIAAEKADRAQELHDGYLPDRQISYALNRLQAAIEAGALNARHRGRLDELIAAVAREHEPNREEDRRGEPLMLAPWLEIIHQDESWMVVRGPGGMVGRRPRGDLHPSWDCPHCGTTGWNGARCVTCGMLDDGD